LIDTFRELREWIVPVDKSTKGTTWYLLFFVTKQVKARVVYDGAACTWGGRQIRPSWAEWICCYITLWKCWLAFVWASMPVLLI